MHRQQSIKFDARLVYSPTQNNMLSPAISLEFRISKRFICPQPCERIYAILAVLFSMA